MTPAGLGRENGPTINLYKQGVFWTAYEQSALILSRHKPLKISVRFVKTVNQQVISVGFPDDTLAFFSGIFGPFVKTDRFTGYFELNGLDAGIDFAESDSDALNLVEGPSASGPASRKFIYSTTPKA